MLAFLFKSILFLFLLYFSFTKNLGLGLGDVIIMLSHISYIRWYGNSNSHKSHDIIERYKRFWKDNIIITYYTYTSLEVDTWSLG